MDMDEKTTATEALKIGLLEDAVKTSENTLPLLRILLYISGILTLGFTAIIIFLVTLIALQNPHTPFNIRWIIPSVFILGMFCYLFTISFTIARWRNKNQM